MSNVETIAAIDTKSSRLRSRVTNGSAVFARGGDGRSAWTRRFKDLYPRHINDYGGEEAMSEAQLALCWNVAVARVELEQIAAKMSEGTATLEDQDAWNRISGNVRRHLETLGLERRAKPVSNAVMEHFSRPPERGSR